jgi:hypothetical protein
VDITDPESTVLNIIVPEVGTPFERVPLPLTCVNVTVPETGAMNAPVAARAGMDMIGSKTIMRMENTIKKYTCLPLNTSHPLD